jgi:hypothetical protein
MDATGSLVDLLPLAPFGLNVTLPAVSGLPPTETLPLTGTIFGPDEQPSSSPHSPSDTTLQTARAVMEILLSCSRR